jgi:WS/DGAT/MGAT family acyltransferase
MDDINMMGVLEPLSGVDRAWLLMDRPTNPMMIVGLIVLRTPLDAARLREVIANRFLSFERFRCYPANEAAGAHWVESSGFDIDDHIFRTRLPAAARQDELETLVGELASTPFSSGRPLWTFHLVENYQGGSAIVVRIHHCYADGIALLRVFLSLADEAPEATKATNPPHGGPGSSHTGANPSFLSNLAMGTLRGGLEALEQGIHYLLHPVEAASAARETLGFVGELTHIATLSDDPHTHLKQPLLGLKRVAWANPLSLEEVRTIGAVLGCTVNDVLVSTLAGALGSYLESQGDKVSGLTIRAAVPVNLRSDDTLQPRLGNRFGLVFVDLPIGSRHPLERLYSVHGTMQALKGSAQALATLGLLMTVGNLPPALEEAAIALFSAKASLVASNLPGPRQLLHIAGAPVAQLLFWVPQAGDIGTGVSMISYCGQVHVGVIADRQLIPRPAELTELIGTEFERLVYLLLLGAGSVGD